MIAGFIGQISSHMNKIALSAKEQSTGRAEINTAVNAMDQSTQRNATMAEEPTAAASSLAQEAAKLPDLVARFKLEEGPALMRPGRRQSRSPPWPARSAATSPAPWQQRRRGGSASALQSLSLNACEVNRA